MGKKFEEIIKNKEYRERVIKLFRLPMRLSVSEEKFMSDIEFLKLIDEEKINQVIAFTEIDFNNEVERQNTNEPDFTMEDILNPIVENFANNPKWQAFEKEDYSDILVDFKGITNTHDFYKKENDNKKFLSIDLVTANWQSLQHIIGFDEAYEDLIVEYTSNLIPPISKTMRTKITGLLNAKKIMDYNKKLLLDNKDKILKVIEDIVGFEFKNKEPFAFYADEFILELSDNELELLYSFDYITLENQVYQATGIKIHFVPFELRWLNLEKSCIKLYKDKEYEILNLSKDILLMVNKKLNNIELSSIDFEKVKKTEELLNCVDNAVHSIKTR